MAFQVAVGVRPIKQYDDSTMRESIYYQGSNQKPVFVCTVGRYRFTNPISATVFSYLNSTLGYAVAAASVIKMEEVLDTYGARWSTVSPNAFDLLKLTPVGKYLEVAEKAMSTAGNAFVQQQLSNSKEQSQYNPFPPTTARRWTGSGVDDYVGYAVAYMAKNKGEGPAYLLLRDDPALRRL
ncbi:MAG: hypothetical protein ABIZ64_17980 [Casimicrobium sp.]